EEQYKKWYSNANLVIPLSSKKSLNFDFNIYQTKYAEGATSALAMGGDGSHNRNTIWSLASTYTNGPHAFTISHQRNTGNTGYAYDFGDGGTIWVGNSLYSDFNLNDERSWLLGYEYNFINYGLPGLTYRFAYAEGSNIVAGDISDGRERELFNQVKYVVQSGAAKDLSLRLRTSIYRADKQVGPDMNEARVFIEYPISIF
ncbi:OprD family outer membrane porin, partial [Pseudomonas putida]